jgi:Rps23 Pro-64 3,4-dihydroxylase Tpa1-like proline 4-hydroxylase
MAKTNDPLFMDPVLLQQAEKMCKARLKNDPNNRAVLRSLAEVYRKLGHLEEAGATYARLFELDPEDREAGYLRAVLSGQEWPGMPSGVRPAPFVVLKDFLPADFHNTLIPFLVSVKERFVPVKTANGDYDPKIRETLRFTDEWEAKNRFRDYVVEALPRVLPRLYLPPFRVRSYEVQVRAYQDGHFFSIHTDADPGSRYAERAVNYVYYFHRQPRPFTGGELLLFDTDVEANNCPQARFTRVVPEDNSIVFFPPNFYHSVVPIRCPSKDFADSRFTLNGHIHRYPDATPAVEGRTEPSTVAVG